MSLIELAEIHKGDIGTIFRLALTDDGVVVDISSATTKEILFKKPDGTVLAKGATFTSNGTDGLMFYQTVSGDLDQTGIWVVQGNIVLSTGAWRTSSHEFKVHENI